MCVLGYLLEKKKDNLMPTNRDILLSHSKTILRSTVWSLKNNGEDLCFYMK